MASKFVNTGLFLLTISLILCTISCIAPYWLINPNIQEDKGLYALCSRTRHRCYWFFEDDFAWQKSLYGWQKSCQALFTTGLALMYVSMLIACLVSCSIISEEARWPTITLVSTVGLACLLMGGTIIQFGVNSHYTWNASMHGTAYLFNWGYFVGISGVLSTFLSCVAYMLDLCFTRTKASDGYLQGNIY